MGTGERGLAPGTVVVVTGASSGIGRAVARAFAAYGARLVVTARSAGALDEVVREYAAAHALAEAVAVPADVTASLPAPALLSVPAFLLRRAQSWHGGTASSRPLPRTSGPS
ncbi:SDR family NAD(P)-dependent oxidoreductase [Streptomyces sp. bgisy126]|uniref:SDR family NAD(P)-dependent oxidoreductase n=1 Tax=unclassified Streptomyces TaxID=2593676 RepID=UPI003EBBD2AA